MVLSSVWVGVLGRELKPSFFSGTAGLGGYKVSWLDEGSCLRSVMFKKGSLDSKVSASKMEKSPKSSVAVVNG